ncbi:UvrD-helicase domain-containing protein [Francisellaceae bacterium]|nr:UvrD-helicase domain-containing protein [Francisellaceae bacterium]
MSQLNDQQLEAVKYVDSPLLVLAGAGSGKTSVITKKIAYLIKQGLYKPNNILAVTFTNKAAREMKERVKKELQGENSRGLNISTFHTFGLNVLKKEITKLGYNRNFTLIDDHDSTSIINEISSVLFQSSKELNKIYKHQVSLWKYGMMLPKEIVLNNNEKHLEPALEIYKRYQDYLKAYNAVDFDDLILLPVLLFKNDVSILEKWQSKIRYLLVDEYQDTNISQYELVKLLVGKRAKFTVVGDDDQSIYAWRGADPKNIGLLEEQFPNLKVIKLEQNYRSSSRILQCANQVIDNNPHLYKKALWSNLAIGSQIQILPSLDEEAEASRIITEIIADRVQSGKSYNDYAILYRGNHQSFLLEKNLQQYRVPYKLSGGASFFSKKEIKDFFAYMRIITNVEDNKAFLRAINIPKRSIGPATISKLTKYAHARDTPYLAAIDEMGIEQAISPKQLDKLRTFSRFINKYQTELNQVEPKEYEMILIKLLEEIQYLTYLIDENLTPEQAEKRYGNILTVIGWLTKICIDSPDETLQQVLNKLILIDMMDQQEEEKEENAVQLLTLHASKGLEFPNVYLMGLEEGLLPHQQSIDDGQIEEERRLMYVGITRARENLIITYAKKRKRFGETSTTNYSRFLDELPEEHISWSGKKETTEEEKKELGRKSIAGLREMLKKN